MTSPVELLEQYVAELRAIDADVPGGIAAITLARDPQLLDTLRAAQAIVRVAQAVVAGIAGEVARRSEGDADVSLARRCGERSAAGLVAKQAGLPHREVATLVKVGEAVRPHEAMSGEHLEAKRRWIAGALAEGSISIAVAELFITTLEKLAPLLWADEADGLEALLINHALEGWSYVDLRRFCSRLPDRLNPDGAEPREDDLRAKARITETRLPNGLFRVTADMDPEMEGWWKAAMSAKTAPRRSPSDARAARNPESTEPTSAQVRLEALVTILRQSLQADDGQAAGIDVTMLVTIDLESLTTGIGTATIADVESPISAATARRLAAQAHLIPQVLSGRSVILDQGLAKRLFTKHQRYALATRDGGCTFPACPMPPGMCEVNHIGKWRHDGPSDLNNGALLCGFHNRLMERGWQMELHGAVPWFTPPSTVDPTCTPVRGGHLRVADAA